MADDEDVVLRFRAEGVEQTNSQLGKLGKQAETARLGLWGLGEAAENAAQGLGVPSQISRQLGNSVEKLASGLGMGAKAFGAIGLAGMAVYGVYKLVADREKKLSEETRKAAELSMNWVESARVNVRETDKLRVAKEKLFQSEKAINEFNLQKGIKEQERAIDEMARNIAAMEEGENEGALLGSETVLGKWLVGTAEERKAELKGAQLDYEKSKAVLLNMKADLELSLGGGIGRKMPKEEKPDRGDVTVTNQYEREAAYQNQLLALYKSTGASKEEIWTQELAAFDITTKAKMANATGEQDYYDIEALRAMERVTKVNDYERKQDKLTNDMKLQMAQATAGNLAQLGQVMSDMGGKNARKWFTLQKHASIAEAIINTYVGADKALGQGGIYGAVLAASVIALGMANVAKIRSTEFGSSGGGSAGGGAVPTFNANPVTGLPRDQQRQSLNLTLIVNGEERRIGEITEGVVNELWRNGGNSRGITVSMKKNA